MNVHHYKVIEDNGGGMYLFFFDKKFNVTLGIENIEHVTPGDLDNVTFAEATTWDSKLDDPQATYDDITSFGPLGYEIVADSQGIYPEHMGCAAQIVYGQ